MRKPLITTLAAVLTCATAPVWAQAPQATSPVEQRPNWPSQAVRGAKAMVVSDEELASAAGVEILKRGGNAVDAAVAVGFALAVVQPAAGNIGGGGFMLVRMADGRTGFVDYRETAPAKGSREMYIRADGSLDSDSALYGYRAVAIPGTPAGMELALKQFGTMKLADVMAPAIRLADGFVVNDKLARSLNGSRRLLQRFSNSYRILLNNGSPFKAGDTLRQPELAQTLREIARGGAAAFYRGRVARELAAEMRGMADGHISEQDMAGYVAKLREPLRAKYKINGVEWEVITTVPPSSGGTAILEALNILAPVELKSLDDATTVHWIAEAMRRAFADRAAFLGDADFSRVPVKGLTDPRYADERRASISAERASSSTEVRAGNPGAFEAAGAGGGDGAPYIEPLHDGQTTHYSVVDAAGNAASNTYTVNTGYGSGVTSTSGWVMNNTMDDFTTHPGKPNVFGLLQSEANTIAPGKRALSSMTPTIVLRDGKLSLVTGSPGGPTIISAVMLSIINWIWFGAEAQAAINAPRFHHQWMPDELVTEETLSPAVREELKKRGHNVRSVQWRWLGQVEAIGIDPKTGERLGAADPRRQGSAIGY